MQEIIISVDGHAQELQLALGFDAPLTSHKDWVVSAQLSHRGLKVSSDDVGWDYSVGLDASFVYLEMGEGKSRFVPRSLICFVPFDEVVLKILPWSQSARNAASAPEVRHCRYAIRSQKLTGENMQTDAHVLGEIDLGTNS